MYYTFFNIKYPFLRACKNINKNGTIKPLQSNFIDTSNNFRNGH